MHQLMSVSLYLFIPIFSSLSRRYLDQLSVMQLPSLENILYGICQFQAVEIEVWLAGLPHVDLL